MYRVQYLCPRQSPHWQMLTGFLWMVKSFDTVQEAAAEAEGLIWSYHSARVVDLAGNVLYQV